MFDEFGKIKSTVAKNSVDLVRQAVEACDRLIEKLDDAISGEDVTGSVPQVDDHAVACKSKNGMMRFSSGLSRVVTFARSILIAVTREHTRIESQIAALRFGPFEHSTRKVPRGIAEFLRMSLIVYLAEKSRQRARRRR